MATTNVPDARDAGGWLNPTHCPSRSGCKVHLEAQGIEDPHPQKRKQESDETIPGLSADCKALSEYVDPGKKNVTGIMCKDKASIDIAAFVLRAKGMLGTRETNRGIY